MRWFSRWFYWCDDATRLVEIFLTHLFKTDTIGLCSLLCSFIRTRNRAKPNHNVWYIDLSRRFFYLSQNHFSLSRVIFPNDILKWGIYITKLNNAIFHPVFWYQYSFDKKKKLRCILIVPGAEHRLMALDRGWSWNIFHKSHPKIV